MQHLSLLVERRLRVESAIKEIFDSLGRVGHLSDEQIAKFNAEPDLVKGIEKKHKLPETGRIDYFLLGILSKSDIHYIHGVSKINVGRLAEMARFGHFDCFDQVEGREYEKCMQYVVHGVNNRINLDQFDRGQLKKLMEAAIASNNVEIVERLERNHGMKISGYLSAVAESNNLDFVEKCQPLGVDQLDNLMIDAVMADSDNIVRHLIDFYLEVCSRNPKGLFDLATCGQTSKSLRVLLERFPDFNIVADVFENVEDRHRPSLSGVLMHGDAETIELVTQNMLKMA